MDNVNAKNTLCNRVQSLTNTDCGRVGRILETCQYTILYVPLSFVFGSLLDMLFPYKKKEKPGVTMLLALFQLTLASVLVIYIRKIAHLFSFGWFRRHCAKYQQHRNVAEYLGEITIAFVFVACQVNLLKRLKVLRTCLGHNPEDDDS